MLHLRSPCVSVLVPSKQSFDRLETLDAWATTNMILEEDWLNVERLVYFGANLAFSISWPSFIAQVIEHWHSIGTAAHQRVIWTGLLSLSLWICLIGQKLNGYSLIVAFFLCRMLFSALLSSAYIYRAPIRGESGPGVIRPLS